MKETNASITDIKGVGEKTAKLFQKLQISNVEDLIHHYPRDYERFDSPIQVKDCTVGEINAVYVRIVQVSNLKKVRNLTILTVLVQDSTGQIELVFFNMPYLKKTLRSGMYYVFRGKLQMRGSMRYMEQAKIYTMAEYSKYADILQPRYALTKGLTNLTVQKSVQYALAQYAIEKEFYPEELLDECDLTTYKDALYQIHFPEGYESMLYARKRLVFDEFFCFMLLLRKNKDLSMHLPNLHKMIETADTVQFIENLPFPLTKGQKKVWQEIRNDMASPYCMNRLIQGDVGSGKTIVALLSLLMCAANGFQGALMAPTEVLAKQHYQTVQSYIEQYGVCFKPVLLVGSMTAKEKKNACELIASGEANLVIGTHALIQSKVIYKNLALVVTDEQHRFGVRQREDLAAKGHEPHVLVMSATPIPRTLAIILYGDLDISIIDELPANRLPIKNCVVDTGYRNTAYRFIEKQVKEGRQAYVICPMVEEGELEDAENVVDYSAKLQAVLPEDVRVAYLHGKMPAAQKNEIMEAFASREIDVLVSTTVIEVGINVPNATVMMVENAERFGLASLHQLRGRVGRGEFQSYCIFISSNSKEETMERLSILRDSNDGFEIASKDLKMRGPGDLFGIRQSGDFSFQLADIYNNNDILKLANDTLNHILLEDPSMESEKYRGIRAHFQKELNNNIDFRTI